MMVPVRACEVRVRMGMMVMIAARVKQPGKLAGLGINPGEIGAFGRITAAAREGEIL